MNGFFDMNCTGSLGVPLKISRPNFFLFSWIGCSVVTSILGALVVAFLGFLRYNCFCCCDSRLRIFETSKNVFIGVLIGFILIVGSLVNISLVVESNCIIDSLLIILLAAILLIHLFHSHLAVLTERIWIEAKNLMIEKCRKPNSEDNNLEFDVFKISFFTIELKFYHVSQLKVLYIYMYFIFGEIFSAFFCIVLSVFFGYFSVLKMLSVDKVKEFYFQIFNFCVIIFLLFFYISYFILTILSICECIFVCIFVCIFKNESKVEETQIQKCFSIIYLCDYFKTVSEDTHPEIDPIVENGNDQPEQENANLEGNPETNIEQNGNNQHDQQGNQEIQIFEDNQ